MISQWAFAAEDFAGCVDRLKERALQASISESVVLETLSGVQHVPRVIELDRKQPEFYQSFYTYYGQRVTENRIELGRDLLRQNYALLQRLERKYGVPGNYLVAFWGMETNFGRYLGNMNTLDSLATLACDKRRSEFFTLELLDALRLIDSGVTTQDKMRGSWAGAMGNMQFMPSTFRAYGVDANSDGEIDLWGNLNDAFTSAAYYLSQLGWQAGWRWGREVLLPKSFDYRLSGRSQRRTLKEWAELGLKDRYQRPIPALDEKATLIVPAGHRGPAFLVYKNFNVMMKWNLSEFYALSVGVLADRINGASDLRVAPPQTRNLSVAEVADVQRRLNALGLNAGVVDGVFGSITKQALQQYQVRHGLVADGFLDAEVIDQLMAQPVVSDPPVDNSNR